MKKITLALFFAGLLTSGITSCSKGDGVSNIQSELISRKFDKHLFEGSWYVGRCDVDLKKMSFSRIETYPQIYYKKDLKYSGDLGNKMKLSFDPNQKVRIKFFFKEEDRYIMRQVVPFDSEKYELSYKVVSSTVLDVISEQGVRFRLTLGQDVRDEKGYRALDLKVLGR